MHKITKETISGSESMFDRKEIVQKQQVLKKLYENNKYSDKIEYFAKLKFRDIVYAVGEYIILDSYVLGECYLAKLTKVIRIESKGNPELFIEVEWVMKKNDLPDHLLRLYGDYISMAEVFPSNEKFYLYVAAIRSKCTILTIEEYGQLSNCAEYIFYSRSKYNLESKAFDPDPSTWPSDCFCAKPNNPDLIYIQCSKCDCWFHQECVQDSIINGEFLCAKCFGPSSSRDVHEIMRSKW